MNGNLKNCPSCGKLFIAQPKQRLCMDCFEKQREEEERIIRYVNAHPEVPTLDEIAAGYSSLEEAFFSLTGGGLGGRAGLRRPARAEGVRA